MKRAGHYTILLLLISVFIVNGKRCREGNCDGFSCRSQDIIADACHLKNDAFVLPDMDCDCCGHCAPVKDVLDPKELQDCASDVCQYVSCTPESVEYCTPGQVLVPYDGRCFCCPTCMDKNVNYVADPSSFQKVNDNIYFIN